MFVDRIGADHHACVCAGFALRWWLCRASANVKSTHRCHDGSCVWGVTRGCAGYACVSTVMASLLHGVCMFAC